MVSFLEDKVEMAFRRFVCTELAEKYGQYIEVKDGVIVTGLTGSDTIEECLNVGFFPSHAKTDWVEDKIAVDIHRYCYENDLSLVRSIVVERTVWNGDIRYGLVYTDGGCYQ